MHARSGWTMLQIILLVLKCTVAVLAAAGAVLAIVAQARENGGRLTKVAMWAIALAVGTLCVTIAIEAVAHAKDQEAARIAEAKAAADNAAAVEREAIKTTRFVTPAFSAEVDVTLLISENTDLTGWAQSELDRYDIFQPEKHPHVRQGRVFITAGQEKFPTDEFVGKLLTEMYFHVELYSAARSERAAILRGDLVDADRHFSAEDGMRQLVFKDGRWVLKVINSPLRGDPDVDMNSLQQLRGAIAMITVHPPRGLARPPRLLNMRPRPSTLDLVNRCVKVNEIEFMASTSAVEALRGPADLGTSVNRQEFEFMERSPAYAFCFAADPPVMTLTARHLELLEPVFKK